MMVLTIARLVLASSALARARRPLAARAADDRRAHLPGRRQRDRGPVDGRRRVRRAGGSLSLERRGRARTGGPRRARVREARGGGGGGARPSRRYVKWLEQAGAAVVPILYNSTPPTLEAQFETLNGVLFTGGPKRPTDFPRYLAAASKLLALALADGATRGAATPRPSRALAMKLSPPPPLFR